MSEGRVRSRALTKGSCVTRLEGPGPGRQLLERLQHEDQERRAREERARERDSRLIRRADDAMALPSGSESVLSNAAPMAEVEARPATFEAFGIIDGPRRRSPTKPLAVPAAAAAAAATTTTAPPAKRARSSGGAPGRQGRGGNSEKGAGRLGRPRSDRRAATKADGGTGDAAWMFDCACGISGRNYDDGTPMIACDRCGVWQHVQCSQLRTQALEGLEFVCAKCVGGGDTYEFRCRCGAAGTNYDDGREMIQCEACDAWQHTACQPELRGVKLDSISFVCSACRRAAGHGTSAGSPMDVVGQGEDVDIEGSATADDGEESDHTSSSPSPSSSESGSSNSRRARADDDNASDSSSDDVVVDDKDKDKDDGAGDEDDSNSDSGDSPGDKHEDDDVHVTTSSGSSSPDEASSSESGSATSAPGGEGGLGVHVATAAPAPRLGFACVCGIAARTYDDGTPTVACGRCRARMHAACVAVVDGQPPLCTQCGPSSS